jgi:methyl-accepting chemotaxis protein
VRWTKNINIGPPQWLDESFQQQAERIKQQRKQLAELAGQVEQQGKKLAELAERVEKQQHLVQQKKEKILNLLTNS